MGSQTGANGKPLLSVIDGKARFPPPVWLMRQAGRYLPEYRALRAKASSFLDFCYTPALAAEATLQPVRRFGFDAAILFSDILVIPDALGQKVDFAPGEGPRLDPVSTCDDFARLKPQLDLSRLSPVLETIAKVKGALPRHVALIGFCGAPWTVACYMVGGQSVPDHNAARLMAYRKPELFRRLIDRLTEVSIDFLAWQLEAGADLVQIFDTWAGVLPFAEFERWCIAPAKAIVEGLRRRHPSARVTGFSKGAGQALTAYARATGVNTLGLDSGMDPGWVCEMFGSRFALQGNLDPLALLAGGAALERAVRAILSSFRGKRHIFNLGHGILPETPPAHVELMLDLIRRGGAG